MNYYSQTYQLYIKVNLLTQQDGLTAQFYGLWISTVYFGYINILPMQTLNQLRSCFQNIKRSKNTPVKKLLLESIISQLRQIQTLKYQQKKHKDFDSFRCISSKSLQQRAIGPYSNCDIFSHDYDCSSYVLSTSTSEQLSLDQLQQRILQKQQLKLQLYQEIEDLEDDYYEMTKILMSKKQYHDRLEHALNTKTIQIKIHECPKQPSTPQESLRLRIVKFLR